MEQVIQYITNPANGFLTATVVYLRICGFSIAIAVAIGILLGTLVSRNPLAAFFAVNISGLMRAIPVIAFLLAALPLLGVGFTPTVIALIILGIPPVLLNTYTGLRGIDPAMIDAATGLGMTRLQIATRVQAPLVLPIIAAGVRTSAVQIVATATLAAIIGSGGYGEYIIDGLNNLQPTEIIAGALPVCILALIIEGLMSWLQFALTPKGLRKTTLSN